jgi:hypothetical protein
VTIHNTLKWRDYFYGNSKNRYGPQIRINYPNSIIANLFQQLPVLILGSIGSKYFTQIAIADKVVKSLAGLTWPIVAILQGKGSGLDRKLFKTKSLVRLQIAIGLIAAFFLFPCACYLLINILKVGSSMFSKFDYGLMGLLAFLIFHTSVQSNFSMVLKRRTLKLLYVNIFSLMLLTLITFACGDSFRFSNYYVALVIIYLLHNLFLLYFSYR